MSQINLPAKASQDGELLELPRIVGEGKPIRFGKRRIPTIIKAEPRWCLSRLPHMSLRMGRSTPSCKYTRPKTNICVCRKLHTNAFLRASSPTAPHPEVRQQNGHEEIVLRPHTRTPGRGRRCPPPGLTSQAWF